MGTLAGLHALIKFAVVCRRQSNDMVGGQKKDPVALAAFAEVQGVGALVTRGVPGSDLNTERVSEWAEYVGGGVHEGDMVEKSRVGGLPEGDLDVGELSVDEDLPAAVAAASASSKDGELGTTPTHR